MITVKQKTKMISLCLGALKFSSNGKNVSVVCPVCTSNGKITTKKNRYYFISFCFGLYLKFSRTLSKSFPLKFLAIIFPFGSSK